MSSRIRSGLEIRVEQGKGDGTPGSRAMLSGPSLLRPVDVTEAMIGAVAHSLWLARGGESQENWADAEDLVRQVLTGRAGGTGTGIEAEELPAMSAPVAARRQASRR